MSDETKLTAFIVSVGIVLLTLVVIFTTGGVVQ